MTALCGGGPSGPKTGVDSAIAFGGTAIDAAVTAAGFPELAPIIGVIAAGTAFATDVYCTTDPPADPGLTQNDILAVLEPQQPLAFGVASTRVLQWFLHWYWWEVCQCQGTVATPPQPAPNLPPGLGVNTGLPSASANPKCWDVTLPQVTIPQNAGQTIVPVDLTPRLLPTMGPTLQVPVHTTFPSTAVAQTIPTGINHATLSFTQTSTNSAGNLLEVYLEYFNSTGTSMGSTQLSITTPQGPSASISILAIPAGSIYWSATAFTSFEAFTATVHLDFYCQGGGPGGLASPCCPPDPTTNRYLQLIYNLVSNLYVNPPSASSPTSLRDGVRHAGLSGLGTVQLASSATAVRAEITTLPAGWPTLAQEPPYLWSAGFITPLAEDVPLRGGRLIFNPQTFPLTSWTTGIAYTLAAGLVVDLVEQLPV